MKLSNLTTDIVRNCSHYSNIQTGLYRSDSKYLYVVKKAFTKRGADEIEREHTGLMSFGNAMNLNPNEWIVDYKINNTSALLVIKYVEGKIGDCHAGMQENYAKLESLLDFYENNNLYEKQSGAHGDLSISNVIYNEQKVTWVIDWENYNELLSVNYDLVYCITEVLLFELAKNKKLDKYSVELYWKLFDRISGRLAAVDQNVRSGPSNWIRSNALLLIESGDHGMKKCPFVKNDQSVINMLDSLLCV